MDIILWFTICLALVLLYTYWKTKGLPPGPYGLPIVGYVPFLGKKPHITFLDLEKKYGSVFSISLGQETVVVVNDFQSIKDVLVYHGTDFHRRKLIFQLDDTIGEKGIVTADGSTWKQHKHFVTKTLNKFGDGGGQSLDSVVLTEAERLNSQLYDLAHKRNPVSVQTEFYIPPINIIWILITGSAFSQHDKKLDQIKNALHAIIKISNVSLLNIFPYLRYIIPKIINYNKLRELNREVRNLLQQEIDDRTKNFESNNMNDVISKYIEKIKMKKTEGNDQPPYREDYLCPTIFNLMIAAVETIQLTLSWATLYMMVNPHVQRKVQEELDAVLPNNAYTTVSRTTIPYTEATLCEVHRMSSIVPLNLPHCTIINSTLKGYRIPKGTAVLTNLWAIHHDKQYWGDPETFRPERFLNDNGSLKKHNYYFPFSAGPRICLGEALAKTELTLLFSYMLHRFSFEPVPGEPKPSLDPVVGLTLSPQPYMCIIKCRK